MKLTSLPYNWGDGVPTGHILLPNKASNTGIVSHRIGQRDPMEIPKQPMVLLKLYGTLLELTANPIAEHKTYTN